MKLDKNISLAEILFGMYLLILPLMNLRRRFPLGDKIQYADFVFILLFIAWLFRTIRQKKAFFPFSRAVFVSLILLIIVNLLACLNSVDFSKSGIDYLGLLYLAALFLVVTSLAKEKKIFNWGIRIIFLTAVVTSTIGLASFIFYMFGINLWAEKFLLFSSALKVSIVPFPRIRSTLLLPEMFISFSQLGLVCGIISLKLRNGPQQKRLIIAGILTIITAALLAYSRPLAGFFLVLALIVWFKKDFRLKALIRTVTAIIFITLLSAAIVTSLWMIYPVAVTKDADAEQLTISLYSAPDIRALLRGAAFKVALKHPFFGIGQGMFTYELKNYIDLEAARNTIRINRFRRLEIDPHCAYFGSIAETGFIGLLSILIFLYFIVRAAVRTMNESPPESREIEFYLLAGLAGFMLTAWFMDIFSLRQFWLNLAFLNAASGTRKLKNE